MGRGLPLWHTVVLGLLFTDIVIFSGCLVSTKELSIKLKQSARTVTLECTGGNEETNWEKDGEPLSDKGKELSLGSALDDPRGSFLCYNDDPQTNASLQVFFRMCQNCVHLNLSTILGIVLASSVATLFLAVAMYYMTVAEPSQRSQASDKENLLANEQLYQPLEERNNGQYSHIGMSKTRHR